MVQAVADPPAEVVADPPAEAVAAETPSAVAAVLVESPSEPAEAVSPEGSDGDGDIPPEPAAEGESEATTSNEASTQEDSPVIVETGTETLPAEPPAASSPPPAPRAAKSEHRLSKKELKKKKAEEQLHKAFSDYFDYSEEIKKIPPHRVLAINRGERGKVLRVRLEYSLEAMHRVIDEICIPSDHPHIEFLRGCARDALARLILPSLEREVRRELTERAEAHAIDVFARNLRNLLLQPPIHTAASWQSIPATRAAANWPHWTNSATCWRTK